MICVDRPLDCAATLKSYGSETLNVIQCQVNDFLYRTDVFDCMKITRASVCMFYHMYSVFIDFYLLLGFVLFGLSV